MEEVDLAYAVMVCDYSIEIIIFRHGPIDDVPYDNWQRWPDTCELYACPGTADKSQVEKDWRPKNDGSPLLAHLSQPMPPPGRARSIDHIKCIEKWWSIEIEYM